MSIDRRRFFTLAGLSTLGLASAKALAEEGVATATQPWMPKGEPLTAKRWAMVVDLKTVLEKEDAKKIEAACHQVHNVPHFDDPKDEVKWIWEEPFEEVFSDQSHQYTAEHFHHKPVLVFCNHCDNPPCVRVCPTKATWRRDADGIVMMDWHRCIGCRYCVAACPYGSRSFNWRDPRPHIEEQNDEYPTRTRGVVEKCNFCEERLAVGQLPACVEACEHGGLVFGDLEDPESNVRKLLRERHALRRRPALGTQPEVFYLVDGVPEEKVEELLGSEAVEDSREG